MPTTRNPGRIAGFWYLLICLLGPLRLIYVPSKLFVHNNPAATAGNIAAHELLFRLAIAADLVCAVFLVLLVMAFYRLFHNVDQHLAALVVILGGVMPGTLYLVNAGIDLGTLQILHGAEFLSAFDQSQRDAVLFLLLRLRDQQEIAAEILWGTWLFPLAILVYRSRFLPRFLGVWLAGGGLAYVLLSLAGAIRSQYQHAIFAWSQPVMIGEIVLTLWLLIKGAQPPIPQAVAPSSSPAGSQYSST